MTFSKSHRAKIFSHPKFTSPLFFHVFHDLLGGVECDVLASLAPPIHLSGERLGWTVLICVVRDFRRMHLEVSWGSASEGHISSLPYSVARKQHGHSAVATITVATSDWPSFSCSVSHRPHSKVARRHHTTSSGRLVVDDERG